MSDAPLPAPLPWQSRDWELIRRARKDDRLPHALLLTGPDGLGKRHFADALAASLLCTAAGRDGAPCGSCRGCDLVRAGTHPDLKQIVPAAPGRAILIDAIRAYTSAGSLTSQAGGYKVVIIEPADAMNIHAANSLLKTLEEPVDWTLMILLSARPGKLPATIRSRCRQLRMELPKRAPAERWLAGETGAENPALLLALASGAPLKARALADPELLELRIKLLREFAAMVAGELDPVAVAAAWSKLEPELVLGWYSGWLTDCLRLKTDPRHGNLINPDQRKRLHEIGKSIEFRRLFGHIDDAGQAVLARGSQLNHQMLLESLLLPLAGARTGRVG